MELQSTIMAVLLASGQALTLDEVVTGVAERLTPNVKDTLRDLVRKDQVAQNLGGKYHQWRYQAVAPKTRRRAD